MVDAGPPIHPSIHPSFPAFTTPGPTGLPVLPRCPGVVPVCRWANCTPTPPWLLGTAWPRGWKPAVMTTSLHWEWWFIMVLWFCLWFLMVYNCGGLYWLMVVTGSYWWLSLVMQMFTGYWCLLAIDHYDLQPVMTTGCSFSECLYHWWSYWELLVLTYHYRFQLVLVPTGFHVV